MTTYTVFVSNSDGSGRINLSVGSDGQASASLIESLVGNSYGESFACGVEIAYEPDAPPAVSSTAAQRVAQHATTPPAEAHHAATPPAAQARQRR